MTCFARLLTFPNVLITGHQGFFTTDAMTNIAQTTMDNIDAFAHIDVILAGCAASLSRTRLQVQIPVNREKYREFDRNGQLSARKSLSSPRILRNSLKSDQGILIPKQRIWTGNWE